MKTIPKSHDDLIEAPLNAALTTLMPNGIPQTTVVWFDSDSDHLRINTMRDFQKEKNLRRDPRLNLFIYDPQNTLRFIEIRGQVVEMTEAGAMEHLDELALRYTGKAPYFGEVLPAAWKAKEFPVMCNILPTHITTLPPQEKRLDFAAPEPVPATPLPAPFEFDPAPLPESHRDLFERSLHGVLTTLMPTGQPQSSLVWYDFDGEGIQINTTPERQKGKNILRCGWVSLLIIDPKDGGRYVSIRAWATTRDDPDGSHIDKLTRRYTRHQHYYGGVFPEEKRAQETRLIACLKPYKITVDAIHR